jgi:exonuclease SbcC
MLESRLPVIEQYANEALGKMPGEMALAIRTQKLSKEGNASETLDVIVTIGDVERGYELLSGGQKFRVDLAMRLALTRVLSSQQIDTLIVDEGFDRFQDDAGREAILETLMAVKDGFSRILVVSHHPDVIDRFGTRLEISMEEGVSHVA